MVESLFGFVYLFIKVYLLFIYVLANLNELGLFLLSYVMCLGMIVEVGGVPAQLGWQLRREESDSQR